MTNYYEFNEYKSAKGHKYQREFLTFEQCNSHCLTIRIFMTVLNAPSARFELLMRLFDAPLSALGDAESASLPIQAFYFCYYLSVIVAALRTCIIRQITTRIGRATAGMSYNSRQRSAGPWRDQYYPYQGTHDQWQASNDAYYGYNNNYGYEDGQYYAPSSSQSNDYYYRNTYEDTNQYGYSSSYPATEHQPARYDEHNYYPEDRHPSQSRRDWRDRRERDYGHARPKESVPAPYRHERDDRPVTPPPPRSPSPSYLKLANEPPESLHSSTEERKLLILDLNVTLVHRSALARPKNKHAPQPPPELDGNGRPLPRLRPVHPRPYMNAFRSYLFAPETRAWLDVMVWSSAQPHSVGDMVERCFAAEKKKLLAVWARDTLGLNKDHYCTRFSYR